MAASSVPKEIKPEDLRGVRNDTDLTPEQVAERLSGENSLEIHYGDFHMRVERQMLETAREQARSLTPPARVRMMVMIDRALRKGIGKIRTGKFLKKHADAVAADLMLWHALKEIGE